LSGDSEIGDRLRSLEDTYKKPIHEIAAWSKLRDELASIVGFDKASSLITILPKKKIEFEVQSLPQVISEAKPIEWLIDGLIPKYGLVLLVGKASTGKSFLALCLAYAIATGREFIGILEPIEKGRVLICDAENYPGLYKQRIEAMGLAPIEDIDMIILSNFAIDKKSHLDRLAELIKERSYKLVIFDAWSNLISRIDENKAAEVSRILSYMRRISYENNCCFLLVHHLRKNLPYTIELKDELRGSSSLTNEADLILLLQQTRFNRILRTIKHRYGEDQAFEIEFRNNGQLEIIGRRIKIEEAEDETSKAAEAIVNYLEIKHSAASRDELINALPYTRATIDRALRFLKNMGRIHAPKRGYYMLPLTIDEVE
jgi:archaellum biogenesis ATPase FlaH